MKSYKEAILRNFPADERMGLYVKPNIPSGKAGRVLNDFTRMNPSDLLACHVYGGVFGVGSIAFTDGECFYDKFSFLLEDLKGASAREKLLDVDVNQAGAIRKHTLKTDSAEAAKALARFMDTLSFQPKADDLVSTPADYSKFSKTSLDWLELRDEVMRTIDLLYERFQNGKLELLEYEEKKADLLSRL